MTAPTSFEPIGRHLRLEYGKALPEADRVETGGYAAYGANGSKIRSKKYLRAEPSIIVGRKGSAGEVTLSEPKFWPLDVTYFVEFDRSRHDLRYLFHLLQWLDIPRLAKGVKPGINRDDVHGLIAPFPPLSEQQRIVATLDEAFDGIAIASDVANECLANASQVAWRHLAGVFEQSSSDWVREPISKRVRFVDYRGKTPPKRDSGIRLITAKNVKMGFVRRQPEEFIDEAAYTGWMTRGLPRRGDVLFTTEAPLGNVAQLDTDEPVVIGQRLITMQPDRDKLAPSFLKYMLLSGPLQSSISAKSTGATVQGIKASLLKQIEIMYPVSVEEQLATVSQLDAIFEASQTLVSLHRRKLVALAELKQSLLARAFAGDLAREPMAA